MTKVSRIEPTIMAEIITIYGKFSNQKYQASASRFDELDVYNDILEHAKLIKRQRFSKNKSFTVTKAGYRFLRRREILVSLTLDSSF